jgi:hypothetical protein
MDPVEIGSITVRVLDGEHGRGIAIDNTGRIEPTDLFLAAAHLMRVGNQLLDAAVMRAAQAADPQGLDIVRAMPAALPGH